MKQRWLITTHSVVATGGVYKGQARRKRMTCTCLEFHVINGNFCNNTICLLLYIDNKKILFGLLDNCRGNCNIS